MTGPLKKGAAHVTGLPSAPCPLSLTQMPRREGPLQVSPGAPPSRKAALHPGPSWPQALELSTLELTAGSPQREEASPSCYNSGHKGRERSHSRSRGCEWSI